MSVTDRGPPARPGRSDSNSVQCPCHWQLTQNPPDSAAGPPACPRTTARRLVTGYIQVQPHLKLLSSYYKLQIDAIGISMFVALGLARCSNHGALLVLVT
jgi:hypothetical protein